MYTVYKHTTPSKKIYIGITCQKVERRWRNGNGYINNKYFTRAINKYCWDNIKHEILFDGLTKDQAEEKEKELIKSYKSNNYKYGYNIESGGNTKGKVNNLTKKKIGKANRGKKRGEEVKRRLSEAHKGEKHWNYGKHWSEEVKKKMSNTKKGKKLSQETRKRISEGHKGQIPWCKGKHHSEETRKKMSEAHKGKNTWTKGRKLSEETKMKLSKKVICVETKTIYKSIKYAQDVTCIYNISKCCRGKIKTAGGYHWKYVD